MSCHCKADSWRRCLPLFLGTAALIAPGIASAQIFYSPTSIAVPVMGSYALLALCVVLLAIALRSGALRQGGVNGFFLLCLAGALLSGGPAFDCCNTPTPMVAMVAAEVRYLGLSIHRWVDLCRFLPARSIFLKTPRACHSA